MFDPFWARVNEAGITVVVHAGDSGYTSQGYASDGFALEFRSDGRLEAVGTHVRTSSAPPTTSSSSSMFDDLFTRFPNLRIASVENGSEFLRDLFKKLRVDPTQDAAATSRDDPVDIFRAHVWINPFWEDDLYEVAELMGADRVIFGSDWPHIEGMPKPLDYAPEIKELDDDSQRLVLRENALVLNERRPA